MREMYIGCVHRRVRTYEILSRRRSEFEGELMDAAIEKIKVEILFSMDVPRRERLTLSGVV